MKKKRIILLSFLLFMTSNVLWAQGLKPGFDKEEYTEMLRISALQTDTPWKAGEIPLPSHYRMVYRSPVTGLDNRWDMWLRDDRKVAVMSIRGTTGKNESWLENFYSAMIPAAGHIRLSADRDFSYHLSDDPKAAVHIGWMIGLGFLSETIVPEFRKQYQAGVRDFIIMGHSQGGAIAFLLNSYLHDLIQTGSLPSDITVKTYCSAGPKPGNLYYAYSYEQMTAGGWAVNVINPEDWVPETPFSIQTTNDFNMTNPFKGARKAIRKMGGVKSIVLGHLYGKLDRSTKKAERKFEKYLGRTMGTQVKKLLPGYAAPALFPSIAYARAGNTVVLKPDSLYKSRYPDSKSNIFIHHMPGAYYYLITH